jgi:hypothetical protein
MHPIYSVSQYNHLFNHPNIFFSLSRLAAAASNTSRLAAATSYPSRRFFLYTPPPPSSSRRFFRRSAPWSNCPALKPVRVEEIPSYPPVRMEQQPRVVCCTGSLRDLLHPICEGHGGYFVLNL